MLITGDETIFALAEQYEPEWATEKGSFASLYLRHPRAFLAAPEVLHAPAHKTERKTEDVQRFVPIVDWLDTLLARYSGYRSTDQETLRKLVFDKSYISRNEVRRALRVNPNAPSDISREWHDYTNELRKAHSITSDMARAEIRRVFHKAVKENAYGRLRALDKIFLEKTEETWKTFLDAVTRTGYDLLDNVERTRNPPPISFGSFEQTRTLVRQIMSKEATASAAEKAIGNLVDSGDTGYSRLLVYAFMYACASRWVVAAQIAQRAIDIAERVRADVDLRSKIGETVDAARRSISGREAYYFKAVAQRLLTHSSADLEEVEALLTRAETALHYDKERANGTTVSNLRFASERAAVNLTRYCFFRFKKERREEGISKHDLLREFMGLLDNLHVENDTWIRHNVERNVLTSIFLLAALFDADGDLDQNVKARFCGYLPLFIDNISHPSGELNFPVPITRLVRAVSNYAIARFGQIEKKDKRKIIADLDVLENDLQDNAEKVIVMPYDLQRFRLIAGLTRKALSECK